MVSLQGNLTVTQRPYAAEKASAREWEKSRPLSLVRAVKFTAGAFLFPARNRVASGQRDCVGPLGEGSVVARWQMLETAILLA